MKNGNGGPPIPRLKPRRPEREPTGSIRLHKPGSPPFPTKKETFPKEKASGKMPPGMPPIPKTSITSPKRDSGTGQMQDFFKAKPEPHSEKNSVEIDVDIELEPKTGTQNGPPSIPVEFGDLVSEFSEPEKSFENFPLLTQKISYIVSRMEPPLEGEELSFTDKGVFAGKEKVGMLAETASGASIRIWMHKLGFRMDSIPTSTIFAFFNISEVFFADAKSRANYVSLYAKHSGGKNSIKLCFHKEETPTAFLSVPLRAHIPEGC